MHRAISHIVLAAINAKYIHTALGIRYLLANLDEFESRATLQEFTILERPSDIAEQILAPNPDVVTFSCYIWNIALTDEVVRHIKAVRPQTIIILGGPEVSFPDDAPEVCQLADHVVCGEGEIALPRLLRAIQSGAAESHTICAPPANLEQIRLPYSHYTDDDIAHRLVYLESSRGCAFGCEFCLSSLDAKVRHFEAQRILNAVEELWQRGVRQFKFIDRTIHFSKAKPLLQYFAQRQCPELFVHFEIVPDHISDDLRALLQQFTNGAIQLEAGVQTFNPEISRRIGRKQNMAATEANIRSIASHTGVHIHSDLVIGLPGESVESFGAGFDRLLDTGAHEIQVGILKRLRGAPIQRHTSDFQMVYRSTPPYDILQNNQIPFLQMQRLKRFSRYFDLVVNNGNFKSTAPLIWQHGSAFQQFLTFSDWLFGKCQRTSGISLDHLSEFLFEYLVGQNQIAPLECARRLHADYVACGRRKFPKCVREFASEIQNDYAEPTTATRSLTHSSTRSSTGSSGLPQRQRRHTP